MRRSLIDLILYSHACAFGHSAFLLPILVPDNSSRILTVGVASCDVLGETEMNNIDLFDPLGLISPAIPNNIFPYYALAS